MQEDELTAAEPDAPPLEAGPVRSPPKPWRPVAGLADRPSRMAFSDRLFFWFVYLGAFALMAVGLSVVCFAPYHLGWKLGAALFGVGVGLFAFGGPSASQEKGYRQ